MNALVSVDKLEAFALGLPQVPCNVVHAFAPGIYIRQVTLPAGAMVIGHRHRSAHLNIMLKGRMTLFNDDGSRSELIAPVVCVAQPGRKTAFVHEEVIWLNLYATDETDAEKIEAEILDVSETWTAAHEAFKVDRESDNIDYGDFLFETGLTEEFARRESENTTDQIPLPQGFYKFKVASSTIQGRGLIASGDFDTGELIGPGRLDGMRTPIGRYANHSRKPNAQFIEKDGDLYLIAVRPIAGATGGLDGDEITVNYREALRLNKRVTQ